MDPIPLCKSHIILTETEDMHLYQVNAAYCQSALASSPAQCPSVAEAVREHVPVGPVIGSLPGPDAPSADDPHPTETLIERYKDLLRPELPEQADFLYLRSTDSFASLRCCVLAATDVSGRSLIAEMPVEEEGRLPFGTDVTAAIAVLQCIGVSTVVLSSASPDDLEEALGRAAPYARLSLGVRIEPEWLTDARHFPNAELFLPRRPEDTARLKRAVDRWKGGLVLSRDHEDFLPAPDGTHMHFIDPTIDISDEIELDSHFSEHLLAAEDEAGAIKLQLTSEEDLIRFEEQVFMLSRPVCLCAEQPELLERALRIYPGLALYDGTWELDPRLMKYFSEKYGMICL